MLFVGTMYNHQQTICVLTAESQQTEPLSGSTGGRAYRWQRERGNRVTYGTPVKLPAANRTDMNSHIFRIFVLTPAQAKRMDREGAYRKTHRTNDN